jgi:hypothetical protein
VRETEDMTELRLRLTGEHAQLGEVPASDVARLIIEVERALVHTAYLVLGRRKSWTGRPEQTIAEAVRLRLRGVESGSVVPVLDLPGPTEEDGTLDFVAEPLGDAALALLLDAAEPAQRVHPRAAAALLDVAEKARIGDRYEALTMEARGPHRTWKRARVDRRVRRSLREYVDTAPEEAMRPDAVLGVLFEANFEKNTARLRSPARQVVEVAFGEDHADDIQAALRQQTALRGEVTYDPNTQTVQRVSLQEIMRGEQLALPGLDAEEYWASPSLDELAEAHGTTSVVEVAAMHDADATDEERDSFMAALAELG